MTFTDPIFLVCLLGLIILYHLLPCLLRPYLLLAASIAFYASWGVEQIAYIAAAALIGWLFALVMGALAKGAGRGEPIVSWRRHVRRLILLLGVLMLIAMWLYGKFGQMLLDYLNVRKAPVPILVPLGISYYTLSVIGYLADVYLRKTGAEKNPLRFLMFIFYFPKILQGPIESYMNLKEQVTVGKKADYRTFCFGAQLFLFGLMKKLVVADRLTVFLSGVFDVGNQAVGSVVLLGLLLRPLELYADFSGCMDMAEGISGMLGISLSRNFNRPFFSGSAAEFWRRWHITLGGWFKTYVYMPLATSSFSIKLTAFSRKHLGKRAGRALPLILPLFTVWILTGLWHGISLPYLYWGLYWGALIFLSQVFAPETKRFRDRLKNKGDTTGYRLFRMIRTYFLFTIGRIITLDHAAELLQRIPEKFLPGALFDRTSLFQYGVSERHFRVLLLAIGLMWLISFYEEKKGSVREAVAALPLPMRWICYYGLVLFVVLFGYYGPGFDAAAFIYMQF